MSPGHGTAPLRVERALSAGLLCGPGGAAAHVLAGGTPPTATALLLVTLAALAGAGLATRRRLGPLALLGLAGGAQLVFHHAFTPGPAAGGHTMHGGSGAPAAAMPGELGMVAAHVAVAVLVAVVAGGLEASWWAIARAALLRLAWGLVPGLPRPVAAAPVVARRPRTVATRTPVPLPADVPEVVGPRGPPAARDLDPTPA